MDRIIQKKNWYSKKSIWLIGIVILFIFITVYALDHEFSADISIEKEKLTIQTVKETEFQELIAITGIVQPLKTVYLDAIEGGNISKVLKESGSQVEKGEVLIQLANSNLQLDVMNREAQLYEQINNLRNTRISMEQNKLNLLGDLADIHYQLSVLKPQLDRAETLFEKGLSSRESVDEIRERYAYQLKRLEITKASYKTDSLLRVTQFKQLEASENRLWRSLEAVGQIAENLTIKAPESGQFTLNDANLQVGQSVNRGERLGQVDNSSGYKVRAEIDEYFLPRVKAGLLGKAEFNNQTFEVIVSKVYPEIQSGRFQVELEFASGNEPQGIRRGLSLRIKLHISESEKALVLPRGAFFQTTGGSWIFKISDDKTIAERTIIKLGRQNPDYFEVLSGLKSGDAVITSAYDTYKDAERIEIKERGIR
ncbi:HlyD family efflux transporter periplasmic adaptor subunit [bacterium]|nr:MAG: HlyD family efflux transporter periplasmic adaptor subunit [bacterium]